MIVISFTRQKREGIKSYILEKIVDNQKDVIQKTASAFQISENTVYRYLRELKKDNIITKAHGQYVLIGKTDLITLTKDDVGDNSEDIVFQRYIDPLISDLQENVYNMWYYCFTEMFNNVIDHSSFSKVDIYINKNFAETSIIISDDGVGIFNKIQSYYHFPTIDDAILVGASRVRILHGTGAGILRQMIRQYLATIPAVKSANDEHVQFGGAGITVVEL